MKVYITSTPEFSTDLVKEVALILNQTPGELEFIFGEPLTIPEYGLKNPKMNSFETIESLSFDELFDLCNTYRIIKRLPNDAYVILITSIKNHKDWFSAFNEKNIFIHGLEWEYYTKKDAKFGISYQVIEDIFQSQIGLNIDDVDNEPNIHMESIGCINDMCMNKTDVMFKLRTADICASCLKRAEDKNVNPLLMDHISRIISTLRKEFVNSYKIESKVKPENVLINPKREIKIGQRNVELDYLNKVLFIFFLKNLQGVETKLIINYEKQFYQIYKEVRDNADEKSINRLVCEPNPTFRTVKSRLNKALKDQLGPTLAEYYILDRVEIRDDYNRYKINLEEEYITIEPPMRK
jgi:hypothetical protein